MSLSNFLDEELHKPSVFKDESRLSSHYVPENLLFRTEELRTVVRHFKSLFTNSPASKRMILHGTVGTGKTSLTKRFGIWASQQQETNHTIQYIHVNCRMNRSPYTILLVIARELNSHIPTRGFSSQELLEIILEILEAKEISLILVLDEIDYVQEEELSNLLYALTRVNDDKTRMRQQVSLILISRSLVFLDFLDSSTRSTLSAATLYLDAYSVDQLKGIINDRVEASFKTGAVPLDSIVLASEIAGHRGDARHAIELLWFAGKYADQDSSPIVYPDYIRRAKSNIEPTLQKQYFDNLDTHKLLLMLAIVQRLKSAHVAHLTTGEVKDAYNMMCEEFNAAPRKHTQLWEYLKVLERFDMITQIKSSQGQRGQTHLISVEDASLQEIEKEVLQRLHKQSAIQP